MIAQSLLTGELVRDAELHDLLESDEYRGDSSAAWLYTRALVAFRRDGDKAGARDAISVAQHRNPHVPGALAWLATRGTTPPNSDG